MIAWYLINMRPKPNPKRVVLAESHKRLIKLLSLPFVIITASLLRSFKPSCSFVELKPSPLVRTHHPRRPPPNGVELLLTGAYPSLVLVPTACPLEVMSRESRIHRCRSC